MHRNWLPDGQWAGQVVALKQCDFIVTLAGVVSVLGKPTQAQFST